MKVFQHNSLDYLSAQLFLSPGPAQHVLDVYMLLTYMLVHICVLQFTSPQRCLCFTKTYLSIGKDSA